MFDRSIPMIGFHTIISEHESVPALIRLIEEGLAPNGVNTIILEVRAQYRCFPEYSPGTVTFEDMRAVADKCEEYGIRLVPLLPCVSHQSSAKGRTIPYPLFEAHPEFLELPHELNTGKTWPDFNLHAWCASNDEVYKYIFPMMDELADACRAQAVHVGMDELFEIGLCPKCRSRKPSELYARNIKIMHDHLTEKGLDMMIWGDRLLPSLEMGLTMWEGDRFDVHQAIDLPEITKDIIICDWHYDYHSHGYPNVEFWLRRGFFMVPSVWNDPKQAKHFFLHAQEGIFMGRRYGWPGTVGGVLYTHWSALDEKRVQRILNGINGGAPEDEADHSTPVGSVIRTLTPGAKALHID